MTPTEIKLLKTIWKNGGKVSESKIINEFKIGLVYSRLICGGLIKNQIIRVSGKQYEITDLGKEQLEKLGIIEKALKNPVRLEPQKQTRKSSKHLEKKKKSKSETKRKVKAKRKIKVKREVKEETIVQSNLNQELGKVLKKKRFQTLKDNVSIGFTRLIGAIKSLRFKKTTKIINGIMNKLRKKGRGYLPKE